MSTIKSSAEHLTLNADGAGKDIILQNNGSTKVTVKSDGKVALGGSTAVTSDSQVAIHGGNLELTTAGSRYWIARASDGVLTGSLYSPTGSVVRLSGAGTSAGTIEFEPRSSNGVVARITGDGLCFNGDTATANSLSDYEEGTWTGTISDGSNNMTMSATNTGNYIKVGQMVTVHGYFVSSAFGSVASGSNIRLTGLPFTNGAIYTGGATGHGEGHSITAGHSVAYHSPPNTSYITLIVWDGSSGTSAMTAGEWGSGGQMIFSLSYRTS